MMTSFTSTTRILEFLLSCANNGFCYLNLAEITKFKCERKNEKSSARCSKMMPSCKWPIQNVIPQLKEDYAVFL